MILPRPGDPVTVLPYGTAHVLRHVADGRMEVVVDRMLKRSDGSIGNVVVVELHPMWIAVGVPNEKVRTSGV